MSETLTAYPLCWPEGWRRTPATQRTFGRFTSKRDAAWRTNVTVSQAAERVLGELTRMGIPDAHIIVSTNVRPTLSGIPRSGERKPDDPGVAVYWNDAGRQRCMAIDRYTDVAQNLAAVAATIEAMRAIERHGGAAILDRAFTGFTALPSPEQWWQVLGFDHSRPSREEIEARYRELAMRHHPDRGGTDDAMARINAARDAGLEVTP